MTDLFGIYAQELLVNKITRSEDHIVIDGVPIMNKKGERLLIDAATFRCLNHSFFKDNAAIYSLTLLTKKNSEQYFFSALPNTHLASFELISMLYAKDQNYFYYAGQATPINEPNLKMLPAYKYEGQDENFPNLNVTHTWMSEIAVGENYVYYRGKKQAVLDAKSFSAVNRVFYKDNANVYVLKGSKFVRLQGFDVDSFIALGVSDATDKFRPTQCYFGDKEPAFWFDYYEDEFKKLRGKIRDEYWWFKQEQMVK